MEYSAFTAPAFYYRRHKIIFRWLAICLILWFVLFKLLFPHPNFMPDSYGYLGAAKDNPPVDTWPIGYSMFLRIESAFTRSDIVLVALQYFFLQATILYFLFGIAHVLQMNKRLLYVLAFLFSLNPVTLLISNYVAADALFSGLSLLWFCLLLQLWIKPAPRLFWIQAVLLTVLFTIRYNALYYPVVALVVIIFTPYSWLKRFMWAGVMLLLLGLFVGNNLWEYKKLTGKAQFSPFGGYMLGGNALFMYSRLPKDTAPVPAKFMAFHQLVNKHIDSLKQATKRPDSTMGVYYIWKGPMLEFTTRTYEMDKKTPYFKRWATMAPFYQEYAGYLIRKHPLAYAEYFMLPNAGYYFAPPAEFLKDYNMGRDSVDRTAKEWFGYKNRQVKSYIKTTRIADYLSVVNTMFNIVFIGCLLGLLLLRWRKIRFCIFNRSLLLVVLLIVGNFLFSVTLAPIVFRYQLLFFVLTVTFGCVLFSRLVQISIEDAQLAKEPSQLRPT